MTLEALAPCLRIFMTQVFTFTLIFPLGKKQRLVVLRQLQHHQKSFGKFTLI